MCVYRLPRDLSVIAPRSYCPQCTQPIAWSDNIPLVSFFTLGGRCRHCQASIPWRYPVVEALTGLTWFGAVFSHGLTLAAAKLCAFSAIMICLVFADLEERILPDEFTLGGIFVGLALSAFVFLRPTLTILFLPQATSPRWVSVAESALGAYLTAGSLWLVGLVYEKIRKREGLGLGDVKMIAAIGAFLGPMPTLLTLMAGSLVGSVAGLIYIRLKGADAGTYELPFGSFLGLAAVAVAFWGP